MPTNLVICARNAIDDATMSASPDMVSTLPPSNLQLPARGRVARSVNAASAQDIKFTWNGAGYYLNFVILSRHNLDPGATWRLRLYSTTDWTGDLVYDSGDLTAIDGLTLGELDFGVDLLGAGSFDSFLGQQFSVHYFTRLQALSGIVTVTNTGNAYGYLEASRLYAGDYLELVVNPQTVEFAWEEDTDQSRSAGGSLRSDGKISYRTISAEVQFVDESQRSDLADQLRLAGRRKDVFLSVFPDRGGELERDYTMLAKYVGRLPRLKQIGGRTQLSMQLEFEEV